MFPYKLCIIVLLCEVVFVVSVDDTYDIKVFQCSFRKEFKNSITGDSCYRNKHCRNCILSAQVLNKLSVECETNLKTYGYCNGTLNNSSLTDAGKENELLRMPVPLIKKHSNFTTKNWSRRYFCGVDNDGGISNQTRFKRFILKGKKWNKLDLTWAVVQPSRKPSVAAFTEQEFDKALRMWSRASRLTFRRVHPQDKNIDIRVEFHVSNHGDAFPFDGEGGSLAHAFYPGKDIGGDIHFDDMELFKRHTEVYNYNEVSLLVIAAHELGHALGLAHSEKDDALMAQVYQDFDGAFTLPDDDTLAIQTLYGNPDHVRSLPKTTTPTTTTTTTPRRYRPRPTPPHSSHCTLHPMEKRKPDPCAGNFDAVTSFGKEIMFFKDEYLWRVNLYTRSSGLKRYRIEHMFKETFGIKKIDAAYPLEGDRGIVLFSGSKVFTITNTGRQRRTVSLRDLNVTTAAHVDAAWRWGHNGHVYLLTRDQYWRLRPDGKVEEDYPRDSAVWRGLPPNISDALTYEGVTYFFRGNVYWEFDNLKMRAKALSFSAAAFWLGCPFPRVSERKVCSAQSTNNSPLLRFTILVVFLFIFLQTSKKLFL